MVSCFFIFGIFVVSADSLKDGIIMRFLSAEGLIITSLGIYFLSGLTGLVLYRKNKISTILCSGLCALAAVFAGSGALIHLLGTPKMLFLGSFPAGILNVAMEWKLDHLSAFFVFALSVLVFCVSIYSTGYLSHYGEGRSLGVLHFCLALFVLSMMLVFLSANAICFYIAWEIMALVSYFLVIFEVEKEENRKAGTLYVVMTHIATALLLIGFMVVYHYTGSFDLHQTAMNMPGAAKSLVFVLFLVGFGTKAGMIPLHIWLPYAHPAAPSNVSALMSGIMIKTAIYGMIRFIMGVLGADTFWWGGLVLFLGIVAAVLGVAYAFMEKNIKRLLAYSSVENIGIILMGLGVSMMASSRGDGLIAGLGLTAALLHAFNHTLFKGGLFLGAGSIQYACHTKDMEQLGGLIRKMPVTAALLLCFSLAVSSLVPFNGFIGEWLILQSLFGSIGAGQGIENVLVILGVAGLGLAGALAASCFVKFFGIGFLGLPRSEHSLHAKEVPLSMQLGMSILAALCLFIGIFPLAGVLVADRVSASLLGASVMPHIHGGFFTAFASLALSESRVEPLYFVLFLALVMGIAWLGIRALGGPCLERKYGTWDCGCSGLSSRMQYTATGFSKPVKIVFRMLYRPTKHFAVTGEQTYHPDSMEYHTGMESIFEKYIYRPLYRRAKAISRKTKFRVQTGNIHSYLVYIFAAVLILMAYNRFA